MSTFEGYLLKDSGWRKGWRKRYFKLSKIYFQYSENESCTAPKAALVRSTVLNVEVVDLNKFHFKVTFKTDSWDLQATNREEMIKWMEAIQPRSAHHLIKQPLQQPNPQISNIGVTSHIPEKEEAHYEPIPNSMLINPRFKRASEGSDGRSSPISTTPSVVRPSSQSSVNSHNSSIRSQNSSIRSHSSSIRSATSNQDVKPQDSLRAQHQEAPQTLDLLGDDDDEFLDFEESSYVNNPTLTKGETLETPTNNPIVNIVPTTPSAGNDYSTSAVKQEPYLVPDDEANLDESVSPLIGKRTVKSNDKSGATYSIGFVEEDDDDEVDGDLEGSRKNFSRIRSQDPITDNHTLKPQTSQSSFLSASPKSPMGITTLRIQEWIKNVQPVEKTFIDPEDLDELDKYLMENTKCLPPDLITLIQKIGNGAFGEVWKGRCSNPIDGHELVAVKTLKEGASEKHRRDFYGEAALLGQFQHKNVIRLHGVILQQSSPWIIIEFAENGALKSFLKKYGGERHPNQLLSYCRDIAQGMRYLSEKGYIHRDLAARNVLVSQYEECKIADFGLSRKLDEDDDVYVSRGGMVAIKWTAPEGVLGASYSSASDVWSAGVTMWEVFSDGANPFSGKSNEDAFRFIRKGGRLSKPEKCPNDVFKVMLQCWKANPCDRPTFADLDCQLYDLNTENTEQPLYENTDGFVTYVNVSYENMDNVEPQ